MKTFVKNFFPIVLALGFATFQSCDKNSDDPAPVVVQDPTLSISSSELSFPGAGGEVTAQIKTNAVSVECTSKPDWVESVTFNADFTTVTVKAKAVAAGTNEITEGRLVLSTVSDAEFETDCSILLLQGIENGNMISEPLTSGKIPAGWEVMGDKSYVSCDSGNYVTLTAKSHELNLNATRLICKLPTALITSGHASSGGNVVYASVDFQGSTGAGMCIFMNDTYPNNYFQFFACMGATSGAFYAFNQGINGGAMALGDAIPGDPLGDAVSRGLPTPEAIPTSGIDGFYRMEITNKYNMGEGELPLSQWSDSFRMEKERQSGDIESRNSRQYDCYRFYWKVL